MSEGSGPHDTVPPGSGTPPGPWWAPRQAPPAQPGPAPVPPSPPTGAPSAPDAVGTDVPGDAAPGDAAATSDATPFAPPRGARRRRRRRLVRALLAVVILLVLAGGGVGGWYEAEAHPFGPLGPLVVVRVADGEATDALVSTLAEHGVVDSSLAFKLYLSIHGTPAIEPGSYAFYGNQPFAAIDETLTRGPDVFYIDVLPGLTVAEIEQTVVARLRGGIVSGFDAAVSSGAVRSTFEPAGTDDLEGLLGSGVYRILPGESGTQLLGQMTVRFEHQAAAAGLTSTAAAKLGLTPYQVVIAASIAQKEGYFDKYMGDVARVIYNRLDAGMTLDMTSTVLYYLKQDGGTVTAADEQIQTPYNTYLYKGLTPTPICVPSPAALAGATSPPQGTWLYFDTVSKTGTTRFATTYTQQLANEKIATANGMP